MAKRWKNKKCTFCLTRPATGGDHVPPDSWFGVPAPPNLITVPACTECNEGWEKDAEYFRAILVASANLEENSAALPVRDAVARSFNRTETRGLAADIRNAFVEVEVKSAGGIHLGIGVGLRYERKRVIRVLEQILRGIFYAETKAAIPPGTPLHVLVDQFGREVPGLLHRQFGDPRPEPNRRVGDVFEYWAKPKAQGAFESLWVGTFYRRVWFAGYVGV